MEKEEDKMRIRKRIEEGSVILKEKPFVYTLSSKVRTDHCDFCFKKSKLMKCSGCRYVYYCGKVCQREGWNIHKLECRNLKQISPRIVPDAARILARLIRKLQRGGDQIRSYYQENNFRMYKDLMSHYSNLKNDSKRMEHFTSLYGVLIEFLGNDLMPNSAELMAMYGRICINSFNIMDEEMQCLGTGMYLGASIIDHSCKPNAVAHFDGITLNIRALKTFEYLDWSQIFISYIDVLNTTKDRQQELESTYYFICQCSKCLEPESLEINGAACPNSKCNNFIDLIDESNHDTICKKCLTPISEDFRNKFLEIMEFSSDQLQNMTQLAYYDVCIVCLEKQKGVLHKYNVKHVKILDMAFQCSIDFGKWDSAREFGMELVDSFLKYYGKINPLTGLLYLKLGKLLLYQQELRLAFDHLKTALEILKITHGRYSNLVKQQLLPLLQQANLEMNGILK